MSTPEDRAKDTVTPATQDSKKPVDAPSTEYVVLIKQDGEGWKVILPPCTARSAEQAVRAVSHNEPGTYVAIPSRSWKPVKVSVETVSRVKLEDA